LRLFCCDNNRLASLPESFGRLSALQIFYCDNNRLESLPESFANLGALQEFYCDNNRLASLPESFGRLSALRRFYCDNNQLESLPESFGDLQQAVQLIIRDNHLQALPDSIFRLDPDCMVHVENNRFAPDYAQSLQGRLGPNIILSIFEQPARQPAEAAQTLEQMLTKWSTEFKKAFPGEAASENDFSALEALETEEKERFRLYLIKLGETQDYKNEKSRGGVVRKVHDMVRLACRDPAYKATLCLIISVGYDSCGDRAALTLNDIEILTQLSNPALSDEEFAQLAIRASRYKLLEKHAENIAKSSNLGDEIESILYYLTQLCEDLALPTTTRSMLYPGMAAVSDEMLEEARVTIGGHSDDYLLAQSDYWINRMREKHPETATRIEHRYGDFLDQAENFDYTEKTPLEDKDEELQAILQKAKNYLDAVNAIKQARRKAYAQLRNAGAPASA
jgi:hypothetical protein